jgi:hypothetical protein
MKQFTILSPLALVSLVAPAAHAVEFEPLKTALEKSLGKGTVFKKQYKVDGTNYDLFYSKAPDGKPLKFASVQKALYKPDCTHTWVIEMKAAPAVEVQKVHVVEMKCKHAFPAKENSFLSQYEGKKIADAKGLDKSISTVATATYTATYTTDAVVRSLKLASQFKP